MSTHPREQKSELENAFRQIVAKAKFTEAEEKDIFEKIEGAIVLRTGGMLIDRLSEEKKKDLDAENFKNTEDIFRFLSATVGGKEFKKIATQATEEVLAGFLENTAKKIQ